MKNYKIIGAILVGIMVMSGCSSLTRTNKTQIVEPVKPSDGIPTISPYLTFTPSPAEDKGGTVQIDLSRAIYPPLSNVQESFEKGEYNAGLETIKGWVDVWEEMGVFKEIEIENKTLSPAPLDGRARVVCLGTKEQGEYSGKLLCPPIDLVNGGLKTIPMDENWDETDKPIMITFERTEKLITKGSGGDLAYQFIDKYQKYATRYIDTKTGQIMDGEYQVPGGEIKLPEIVPESMNQIEELSFNMEFKDPKAAYRMLLERVVGDNLENQQFWQETLGTSTPTVDQLLAFARNNVGGPENKAYWLPFSTNNDTKFNYLSVMGTKSELRMTKPKIDGVYIDGIYSMFFYPGDLKDFAVADFIRKLKLDNNQISMGLISGILNGMVSSEYGLLIENNRFIFISGSEHAKSGLPAYYDHNLGGGEQVFRGNIDPAIVSAQFLSYLKAMSDYDPFLHRGKGYVCTNTPISSECPGGVTSRSLTPGDWVVKIKD